MKLTNGILALGALIGLTACATTQTETASVAPPAPVEAIEAGKFERDREAILAMQGEYRVTFDFTEVLAIEPGYELKEPKITPAREIVYVIEDTGDYIALQHLLLVGPADEPFVVKHWRQDWQYQPSRLMAYRGFGDWDMTDVASEDGYGAWSQTVYQVDDSPRYAGLAVWVHDVNSSTWEPAPSWRPLPRRDATTRDDYDVIEAVNRHSVMDWGWSHEQDNSKLVLRNGEERELVREHGLNTYVRSELENAEAVADYWQATQEYWADIREVWTGMMDEAASFHVEDDADGTLLYGPVLNESMGIFFGSKSSEDALEAAVEIIDLRVTLDGAGAQ